MSHYGHAAGGRQAGRVAPTGPVPSAGGTHWRVVELQRTGQQLEVARSRHLDDAEALQVRRPPLHVEQPALGSGRRQDLHQGDEGDLGRVPADVGPVEHRLAREQPAQTHAVEAAGQLALGRPGLDRVHLPLAVQLPVDAADVAVDPAVRPPRVPAAGQHGLEVGVHPDLVAVQHLAQRAGDAELVQRQDGAVQRRPPAHHPGPGGHREHPAPVGLQHQAGVEGAAHRDEVVAPPQLGRSEGGVGHLRILRCGCSRGKTGVRGRFLHRPATYAGR